MNILEIIERNHFLKQLYPSGIHDFFIGRIDLSCFDRSSIRLHVLKKPEIDVKKWGVWSVNYNVVVIELLITSLKRININGWQNNQMEICEIIVKNENEDNKELIFKGKNWNIEITFGILTFQNSSTYLIEN